MVFAAVCADGELHVEFRAVEFEHNLRIRDVVRLAVLVSFEAGAKSSGLFDGRGPMAGVRQVFPG